jgi:predicted unusual protein kinase regulating ubiquinone biosynthesis (AarF/ABC1/UbiB family)
VQLTSDEARVIAQVVGELDMLVWKKLIQSISNNSAFFGEGAQDFFKKFQDDLPKMPAETVIQILTEDFGKPPSEMFVDFDPEKPIKSATIGQTYKAKIRTPFGLKEVIVKVQRPGLQESLDRNRQVNAVLMKLGKVFFGTSEKAQILDFLVSQVTGFEDAVQNEIDLRRELENLERARKLLAFQFGVRIPKPIRRYSSSRVLTMEVLPGENIDTLLKSAKDLRQEASAQMFGKFLDAYLFQVFGLGHLHGDMHPGNVLATIDGDIGLIDWAQTFRTRGIVSAPAKAIYYFYRGNAEKLAENFIRMNDSPGFQTESFTSKVQEILDQNKIGKNTLLAALSKAEDLPMEEAASVFGEIYATATELGFKARPAYFQMIRTSTPALNVLLLIGKSLPTEVRNKILISKVLWLIPGGAAKAIGGYALEYLSRPQREIARRLADWNRDWSRSRAVKAAAKLQAQNVTAGLGPVRMCRKAHAF